MPPAERETRNEARRPLKRWRTDGLTLAEQECRHMCTVHRPEFRWEVRQAERIFEAPLNAEAQEMCLRMRYEWEKVALDCYNLDEMLKMNLRHEIATTKAEFSALEEEIADLKVSVASNK